MAAGLPPPAGTCAFSGSPAVPASRLPGRRRRHHTKPPAAAATAARPPIAAPTATPTELPPLSAGGPGAGAGAGKGTGSGGVSPSAVWKQADSPQIQFGLQHLTSSWCSRAGWQPPTHQPSRQQGMLQACSRSQKTCREWGRKWHVTALPAGLQPWQGSPTQDAGHASLPSQPAALPALARGQLTLYNWPRWPGSRACRPTGGRSRRRRTRS